MQTKQQSTTGFGAFGGFFSTTARVESQLNTFSEAQLDKTCATTFVSKFEHRQLFSKVNSDAFFSNLPAIIGMDYSFVIQTNLESLRNNIKFNTRRDLAYNMKNLRIIHVVNSGYTYMGKQMDPYFLCATTHVGSFAFGSNTSNAGIEFSVYDMAQQKYTMLHYVDRHDMFQNKMSFDYNDYYFGTKRKFENTRQEDKRQEVQSKRIREDYKQPKVETRVV